MAYKLYTYDKFGDHCIAFGIIKEFAKRHDQILMYTDACSKSLRDTNKRLYSSLKNVTLMDEPYKEEIHMRDWGIANTRAWLDKTKPWIDNPKLPIPNWFNDSWKFDVQWYMNANIPLRKKWDNFYFERDNKKEKEAFYDILQLKDKEKFIFIHEDPERNWLLKKDNISKDIRHIYFSDYKNINILDILYTVERALEVHTFNTGLCHLIDYMNINHNGLYFHQYIRPLIFDQPVLLLNWKRVN
jgi:hypothetical protein